MSILNEMKIEFSGLHCDWIATNWIKGNFKQLCQEKMRTEIWHFKIRILKKMKLYLFKYIYIQDEVSNNLH